MKADLTNKVTVVIRNRNENEYIGFALQSVLEFLPKAEVLVIDNNSTDDSLKIVKLFNKLNITVHKMEDYTPGKALNFAAEKATNETILILSAHCRITKMDIQGIFDRLKTHSSIFGKQTPVYKGKKISRRYIWSNFTDKEEVNMVSPVEDRLFLHNAFCFYNRQALLDIPFKENLAGKEDRYWAIDAVKASKTYLYTPEIEVDHFYTSNGATWKGIG